MSARLSANTQAILLLTAPLIVGRNTSSISPLTTSEYTELARRLHALRREPADLLGTGTRTVLDTVRDTLDAARVEALLARGFVLSQAIERWHARAIWVVSRADPGYPRRLKRRLAQAAPPVLYGCGDARILDSGGLAVVGSRNVDDELIAYSEALGRLAAASRRTIVSGGARGIDQAAVRAALDAGGRVAGVLADGLEKAALLRGHRNTLMDKRLVLLSPCDPAAGFHAGRAMQCNKLIYALSDAALVVSSNFEKGGTWAGAIEQLDKLRLVPVYVRAKGEPGKGLDALRERGACPWPGAQTPDDFHEVLDRAKSLDDKRQAQETPSKRPPASPRR